MGYVVARGSQEAILNAEALFRELLPRGQVSRVRAWPATCPIFWIR